MPFNIAWRILAHQKGRTALAIGGIFIAILLIFVELGFFIGALGPDRRNVINFLGHFRPLSRCGPASADSRRLHLLNRLCARPNGADKRNDYDLRRDVALCGINATAVGIAHPK